MKTKLLIIAGLSTLLLAACGSNSKDPVTIVIFDENHKEVQRIEADDYTNYSDAKTGYWIGREKHVLVNVPHDVITK